jgi:hypothetical protein
MPRLASRSLCSSAAQRASVSTAPHGAYRATSCSALVHTQWALLNEQRAMRDARCAVRYAQCAEPDAWNNVLFIVRAYYCARVLRRAYCGARIACSALRIGYGVSRNSY